MAPAQKHYPAPPQWWRRVQEEIRARGWTQREFAKMLPVSVPQLSILLNGKNATSSLVPRVCELLGWPLPYQEISDPTLSEVVENLAALRETNPDQYDKICEAIRKVCDAEAALAEIGGPQGSRK